MEGWGWEGIGKARGRKGRGGRGNKHTRFKTCGAAHADRADLVLIESYLLLVVMSFVTGNHLGIHLGFLPVLPLS